MNQWLSCLALCVLFGVTPLTPAAEPFTLKNGDRVVLIGNTLIEREQRYGYWELALTRRFPGVTFRNLGWSGDTVWGEARASFGTQADGFRQLKEHVLALKPTILIIGYGGNEAFDGPAGLPKFEKGLNDLLDTLAPAKARVVLISPPPHEKLGPPLPDPTIQNKNIALYRDVIRETAKKRGGAFVDLFALLQDAKGPLTDDSMHFTKIGYARSALALEHGLGLKDRGVGTLPPDQAEKLRQTIIEKNRLYFHRWRPENETYIFGFRKGEQGKNAVEIPQFDPLVAEKEAEIAKLRVHEIKPE